MGVSIVKEELQPAGGSWLPIDPAGLLLLPAHYMRHLDGGGSADESGTCEALLAALEDPRKVGMCKVRHGAKLAEASFRCPYCWHSYDAAELKKERRDRPNAGSITGNTAAQDHAQYAVKQRAKGRALAAKLAKEREAEGVPHPVSALVSA